MKKALILIALVLLMIPAVGWFLGDDDLDEGAQQWLQYHEDVDEPGGALVYLLGLDAPEDQDPMIYGSQRLEAGRRIADVDDAESEPGDRLTADIDTGLLEELVWCRDLDAGRCAGMPHLVRRHHVLIDRYREWPQHLGFEASAPDLWVAPPVPALVAADRLARMEVLYALLTGNQGEALEGLVEINHAARTYVRQAHSLLQLTVGLHVLGEHVDFVVDLHNHGLLETAVALELLAGLDESEAVLEQVMRGEFGLLVHGLDRVGEWDDQVASELGWVDRVMLRLFQRRNMTVNAMHEQYRWVIGLHDARRLAAVAEDDEDVPGMPLSLRNYWSYIAPYGGVPAEGFLTYVARMHDLEAGMALGRAWVRARPDSDDDLHRLVRVNPYGPGYGVELDERRGIVCLAGPIPDPEALRCIPLGP